MARKYWLIVGIITLSSGLDQGTKLLARSAFVEGAGDAVPLLGDALELRLRFNEGVAWGIGSTLSEPTRRVAFPLLGVLVGVALGAYLRRIPVEERLQRVAVALVLGGGLGNFIDRLRFGAVVDFIGARLGGAGWTMSGTFNLADVWMVVGVVLLAAAAGRRRREPDEAPVSSGGSS